MTRLDTYFCLGAGGEHPRVDAFCPKTRTVMPLVTTSPGQSVYRVLVHRGGGSLIIGTKSGVVQHCRLENTALGTEPAVVGRASGHIGGPLLSLADLGNDLIAASSMNGSLSILRSQDLAGVRIARTAGPAICGIASVTDDTFATLDECGCIELRSLPDGVCVRFTKAQPPPA